MTVACDFCRTKADRSDDVLFVAAPSGLAHICEDCVDLCRRVVAARKERECAGA